MLTSNQVAFLKAMLSQYGLPYLWDGKGLPGEAYDGRDCSGYVSSSLKLAGGPDWRGTYNTAALWALPAETVVSVGTLCLYGDPVDHVMVVLDPADGVVIGSHGGDHTVTTIEMSQAKGAGVGIMPQVKYRDDFAGFRRIDWLYQR